MTVRIEITNGEAAGGHSAMVMVFDPEVEGEKDSPTVFVLEPGQSMSAHVHKHAAVAVSRMPPPVSLAAPITPQ